MKHVSRLLWASLLSLFAAMSSRGQFEYTTNADNGITITGYDGPGGAVSIPSMITGLPVTDIAFCAFFFDEGITSVTIPGSVITIEDEAFYACSELAEVTISNGVVNIGAAAFEDSPFTKIFIPASVTNMEAGPFEWCSELTTITVDPQNAFFTSIDGIVFDRSQNALVQYPNGLEGPYSVPSNLTVIEPDAFASSPNLTAVTIAASITNMGEEAFSGCTGLTNVTITDGATSIGTFAFYRCTNLASITIPESVTNIGPYAFQYSGLTTITISNGPGVIDDEAFIDCRHLTSVTVPASVTNIGPYAFSGCIELTNVGIPSSVVTISDGAFYGCPSLITLVIPAAVADIGEYAFDDCSNMNGVFFEGNAPSVDSSVFEGDFHATAYYLPGTTGWNAFATNAGIPTVLWNPTIETADGNFGVRNGQFGFDITGTTNIPIVVEVCTNLANPVWVPLQSLILTNGLFYFSEPFQSNTASRFYRISSP